MKIFVRHVPGAAGNFLSLLVHSLLTPTEALLTPEGSAHGHGYIYSSHNYDSIAHTDSNLRNPIDQANFLKYTEEEYHQSHPDALEGMQWFNNNLYFNDTGVVNSYGKHWHIIRTHSRNLNSMILSAGIDDSKIIDSTLSESNVDQMCYNFVVKTILVNPKWAEEWAEDTLVPLHHWYPEKSNIDRAYLNNKIQQKDIKFLSWLIKLAWKNNWEKYSLYTPPESFKIFKIDWNELISLTLIDRLDQLANFLEITLDKQQRNNAIKLITQYSKAQTPVPFVLKLNDY